jgi:hypothetical protein
MQTSPIMDKGVIENFYNITTMDECELDEIFTIYRQKYSKY